jgi:hypothetical protein
MELIHHRRNSIEDLVATDIKYGVELDIRSHGDNLIIHHDPLRSGLLFTDWLEFYRHGTLILNVKEEGLEKQLIKLMRAKGITDYFFLDQSFPFLVKWAKFGERRCAVRVSEYESVETALSLSGLITWVWLDCFTKFPIETAEYKALKDAGFKICLVSPELQGMDADTEIVKMANFMKEREMNMDAVCTKRPDLWEKIRWLK